MRGRGALALAAAAALVLTGCGGRDWLPYAREMGDMAVLRTLGVDGGAGEVELTAATGERVSGMSAQSRPALVLSARGRSLSQACLAVQGLGSEYVFFGYVDQILLGEGLAREDVMPLLNYLAGDVELGLGAQLWVIQGARAGEAIQAAGEEGVSGRLTQLQADSEMGAAEITRTAGELLTALESGTSTYLPALALTPDQQKALTKKLESITGKTVYLDCRVEPGVLGGIRLEMDGVQLDGTVERRLADLKASIRQAVL